jgi:hypothetical protein
MPKWDPELAYQERIRIVKVITHVINDGSAKYSGRREWRVYYLGYLDGMRLFYGNNASPADVSSWYQVLEHFWMYQNNDAHATDNYWWTMDESLAQEHIQGLNWKVEDVDA